jgi:hypothetical protein
MFLFIKLILCILLITLWLRECKKDPIPSFGNYFFILFVFTLIYDIFALNYEMITLKEKPINLFHLIIDRNILLPMSLFFFQRIYKSILRKILFSVVWITMFYFTEKLNEQFQIVNLKGLTLIKCGYIGGIIVTLSLIMSLSLDKLARSRINNAPSN